MVTRPEAAPRVLIPAFLRLTAGTVRVTANVVGTHVRAAAASGPIWTVGGWYDAQLTASGDGYTISGLTLHSTWQTGNFAVMAAD
jgi:hypothetical protein